MQTSFLNYLKKEKLFSVSDKILLAVSGGIDSIVLCDLFDKAGLKFGIAHCNFKLRGKESDKDEKFVESLATKYNVTFHSITFKTDAFAKKNKLSIQVAARELRYNWFEEVKQEFKYKYIATAHHLDDSIETFFINFTRGTGISGLHGILPKQGDIIRPMLFATKADVETYAKKHKLKHREDSSNVSDKYTRNKIRHHIIPLLKELNPAFEKSASTTIQHLIDVETVYKTEIENKRSSIVKTENGITKITIASLQKLTPLHTYLYEFLKPFNFNTSNVEEIIVALNGESGKQFFSETHRLIKDRNTLLVQPLTIQPEEVQSFKINKEQSELVSDSLKLEFKIFALEKYQPVNSDSVASLDFDKLHFPLELRKWQHGDVFYPLGMKGKKKKLSDFFIDKKLSLYQKENCRLLTSEGKIAWIIGLRIDDRFKVSPKTSKIYQATLFTPKL